MIFSTAKRLVSILVLGFALLGFLAVPLFDNKTGFEHTRDFLSSDEAKLVGSEIEEQFDKVQGELDEMNRPENASESSSPQMEEKKEEVFRRK